VSTGNAAVVKRDADYVLVKEMIKEDLIAERVAIESYREMVAYIAEKRSDNTSPP
jgi:bacterioferritin (cytochrome b1)